MLEHIARMGPTLVVAGLLAGWMAEAVSRARGYGLIPDMMVGLVGSVVAGAGVRALDPGAGMLATFAMGCVGAALAIVVQRALWRSTRLGT